MDKTLKKYLIGDFTPWRLIRSVIFIYLCLAIFAFFWSDRMIFQPQRPTYEDTEDIIKLELGGGQTISAIHLESPEARFTILYNHANAVDLGDIRPFLEAYRDLGFSVFSYDYPGYGTSPGKPTTANAYASVDAAMDYVVDELGVKPGNIIVHGRSVGGGPALYLAQTRDVAGVVVESSFVTAFRTATHVPLLPFDKFRNIRRMAEVNCPVLVIHGLQDGIIPPWHGEELFEKAKEPKTSCWLEGTSHNRMPPEDAEKYWAALVGFGEMLKGTD